MSNGDVIDDLLGESSKSLYLLCLILAQTTASSTTSPSTPTSPSGTPGNIDIPSEETLPPPNPPSTSSETRPESKASEGTGDPNPQVVDSTKKIVSKEDALRSGAAPSKSGCERRKWKGRRSSLRHVNEENVDEACLEKLRALVEGKTETMQNLRARVEKAEQGLRLERQAHGEWMAKHFRRTSPEQVREHPGLSFIFILCMKQMRYSSGMV